MAVTTTPLGAPTSFSITKDSSVTNTFATSTNVRGGSTTFYGFILTYPTNPGAAGFLKLYDNDGSDLTAGTTEPDFIIKMDLTETAHKANGFFCHEGALFSNGLTYLMANAGGKSSAAGPSNPVIGHILAT